VVRNENFPGVIYKNLQAVKSILIFASGKAVFTGAKSKEAIDRAFIELKEIMKKFAIPEYSGQP
jgi:TATA-box binding protein (TBP) (component of TFIID and TFIIIB)